MRVRRKRHLRDQDESGIDLTPLLDVVFIMLIFFIVTSTFTQNSGLEIKKPETRSSKQLDGEFLIIAIDNRNRIWSDNKIVDRELIENYILSVRNKNPNISLVIEADKDSKTDYVVSVMDAARTVGITKISIASETR